MPNKMNTSVRTTDQDWREYEQLSGLYTFYLKLIVNTGTFSFAITGGIVSYILKEDPTTPGDVALVLPVLLCFGLSVTFWRSRQPAAQLAMTLNEIRDALGIRLAPHVYILQHAIVLFAFLYTTLTIGTLGLLVYRLLGCGR